MKIQLIKNHKMAMVYIGKYVAKTQSSASKAITIKQRIDRAAYTQRTASVSQVLCAEFPTNLDNGTYSHDLGKTGKHWGIYNKSLLPFAERKVAVIRDEQMEKYLFWMIRAESRNKAAHSSTAFLFTDDSLAMLEWANSNAYTSGKAAYGFLRTVQRGLKHAERLRSKMSYKPREIIAEHEVTTPF